MDVDHRRLVRAPVLAIDDLLDDHGERMRQFVVDAFEGGLADEFRHQDLLGFVGELTVGIERRTFLHQTDEHVAEDVELLAGLRRHGGDHLGVRAEDLGERHELLGNLLGTHPVDLGDHAEKCGARGPSRGPGR